MAEEIRLGASGIWSDSSDLQAPPGALREALNVRIRKPNVIEPRDGYPFAAEAGPTGRSTIIREWQGGILAVSGTELHHVIRDGGTNTEITDPDSASLAITYADSCLVEVSDGVMVPTDNGVYYVDADLDGFPAGLPKAEPPAATSVAGTGSGGIAVGEEVAVRVLFVTERASGREVVSAPSDRVVIANTTGATAEFDLRVPLPSGIRAGMELEVYSTDTAATAGDEMFLIASDTVASADVTAGYIDFVSLCDVSPIVFGKSLYTNETQEGILQANTEPLPAKRVAWFNQMAFYGDLSPRYAYRHTTRTYDERHFATSLVADTGVSWGSGVTTISTGITTSLWSVGMYVCDVAGTVSANTTNFSANTKVTAVGGSSITIDKATLGAAGPVTLYGMDAITIAGNEYIQAGSTRVLSNREFGSYEDLQYLMAIDGDVTLSLADEGDTEGGFPTLVFESDAAFSLDGAAVQGFNGGNFPTAGGAVAAATDDRTWPARLAWSKTLEPEHVPLVHFIDIGSHVEPILGLEATRDSLYVLKADGCWRVSGFDPESLRVDEIDRSIELIHPRAVTTHGNDVWAWTTRGILRINEGGAMDMSSNTIGDMIADSQQNIIAEAAAGTWLGGCFAGSSHVDDIVVFGAPASDADATTDPCEYAYVYEAATGAWVRWQGGAVDLSTTLNWFSFGTDRGVSVFGAGAGGYCFASSTNVFEYTTQETLTGATTNVTGPDGNVYPGGVDDINNVARGWRVGNTALVLFEQTGSEDHILSAAVSNGPEQIYCPFECRVDWSALSAGNPGQLAHWRDVQFLLADGTLLPAFEVGFVTERSPTEATIDLRTYSDFERPEPLVLRGMVTRAHARAKRLRVRASATWVGQKWRLEGVAVTFNPQRGGERTP